MKEIKSGDLVRVGPDDEVLWINDSGSVHIFFENYETAVVIEPSIDARAPHHEVLIGSEIFYVAFNTRSKMEEIFV